MRLRNEVEKLPNFQRGGSEDGSLFVTFCGLCFVCFVGGVFVRTPAAMSLTPEQATQYTVSCAHILPGLRAQYELPLSLNCENHLPRALKLMLMEKMVESALRLFVARRPLE